MYIEEYYSHIFILTKVTLSDKQGFKKYFLPGRLLDIIDANTIRSPESYCEYNFADFPKESYELVR